MARPRRSEHTRESLLDQGVQLLSIHGYHGTGLRQILDTVKVPKGSFYNYFGSKEAFAAEIIDHYMKSLFHLFDAYVASTRDDPLTIIRTVYKTLVIQFETQGCHRGCLLGNLSAEIGGTSEKCREVMLRGLAQWKRRFVTLLERAQAEGALRDDMTAEQMADLFWDAWQGGLLRMKVVGSTEHLHETVRLFFDGLFKPGGGQPMT